MGIEKKSFNSGFEPSSGVLQRGVGDIKELASDRDPSQPYWAL